MKFPYTEPYTEKCYLRNPRSDQAETLIMRSFRENDFNNAIGYLGTVFLEFQMYLSTSGPHIVVLQADVRVYVPRTALCVGVAARVALLS